ncbi:LytTR family DNA-binding domain-containing protein [Sphingobacterium tabacisoli]|uniref:LytTR family DNA-binding domain-containing protein n=1 Tax=Sphingobacterium tabacisoli TaxID=2044855 RepID=A0ABW5L5V8_9SPHI|nr:LytTR family DNA-binding domain-containing protein [Sphingobacterium tabacisoli]
MKSSTNRYRPFHIPAWLSGILFAMLISVHGHQGKYFEALDPLTFVFIVCLYVLFVMLTVYFMVWCTVVLNREHPWHRSWVPRLFYQTAAAGALPLFFLTIAHRLIAQVLPVALQQSLYLPTDAYFIVSFLIILNGWFGFMYVIDRGNRLSKVYWRLKANQMQVSDKVKQFESKYNLLQEELEAMNQKNLVLMQTCSGYEAESQTNRVQQIISDVKHNELQDAYKLLRDNYLQELSKEKKTQELPLHVVEVNSQLTGYKDDDIAYFRTAEEMIFIGLRNGEEYFYQSGGLNRLEKQLKERDYMRINRNYLVPLSSVMSATQHKADLLEIILDDAKHTKMVAYKTSTQIASIKIWLLRKIKISIGGVNHGG